MEQDIEGGKMHEAVSQEQDKQVIKTDADTTLTKQELREQVSSCLTASKAETLEATNKPMKVLKGSTTENQDLAVKTLILLEEHSEVHKENLEVHKRSQTELAKDKSSFDFSSDDIDVNSALAVRNLLINSEWGNGEIEKYLTSLTITDTINPYDLDVLNRVGKNWEHLKHIVGFDQIGNILRCKLLHLSSFVNEDNELSRIEVLENCMELGTMNNNKDDRYQFYQTLDRYFKCKNPYVNSIAISAISRYISQSWDSMEYSDVNLLVQKIVEEIKLYNFGKRDFERIFLEIDKIHYQNKYPYKIFVTPKARFPRKIITPGNHNPLEDVDKYLWFKTGLIFSSVIEGYLNKFKPEQMSDLNRLGNVDDMDAMEVDSMEADEMVAGAMEVDDAKNMVDAIVNHHRDIIDEWFMTDPRNIMNLIEKRFLPNDEEPILTLLYMISGLTRNQSFFEHTNEGISQTFIDKLKHLKDKIVWITKHHRQAILMFMDWTYKAFRSSQHSRLDKIMNVIGGVFIDVTKVKHLDSNLILRVPTAEVKDLLTNVLQNIFLQNIYDVDLLDAFLSIYTPCTILKEHVNENTVEKGFLDNAIHDYKKSLNCLHLTSEAKKNQLMDIVLVAITEYVSKLGIKNVDFLFRLNILYSQRDDVFKEKHFNIPCIEDIEDFICVIGLCFNSTTKVGKTSLIFICPCCHPVEYRCTPKPLTDNFFANFPFAMFVAKKFIMKLPPNIATNALNRLNSLTPLHLFVGFEEGYDGSSIRALLTVVFIAFALKQPIYASLAMTGCLDIDGNILPVDFIKEKIIAGLKACDCILVIPDEHKNDAPKILNEYSRSYGKQIPEGRVQSAKNILDVLKLIGLEVFNDVK